MTDQEVCQQVLKIVGEIYREGKVVIGGRWSLYTRLKHYADTSDFLGTVGYFEECLESKVGRRVAGLLEAADLRSLESEKSRIERIIAKWLHSGLRDGFAPGHSRRLDRLEGLLSTYGNRLGVVLVGFDGTHARVAAKRMQNLKPIVPRKMIPDAVQVYAREAFETYARGLSQATAVLCRAAVGAMLSDRLSSIGVRNPVTRDFQTLVDQCRANGALHKALGDKASEVEHGAREIVGIGGNAAHANPVPFERAAVAFRKTRGIIAVLYG